MASVWYATREDVKAALDSKETARNNAQIDRLIAASSRSIEEQLHRRFYPTVATRKFPWPSDYSDVAWRLWLEGHELISVTSITADDTAITSSEYFLEPFNDGPPYTRVEIDRDTTAYFGHSANQQRDITIVGTFGYWDEQEAVGSLSANLNAGAASTASASWTTADIGVGDILKIDSERLIITKRTMVDSTQNLGGSGLTAAVNDVTVPVSNGAGFDYDEIILIDSERMLVVDIAGNNLTVKRQWDGSVLAAHSTNADIYALTGVELARGQLGTTDAAHTSGTTIYRYVVPDLIKQLCIAETIVALLNESSGYGRVIGSGDAQREAAGKSLEDLRRRAYEAHGRKVF
ncbi:MAG TPA: hypothetical protein VGX25_05430 [Actinophytocola sp.]|uniref:hypothetical protein n=1 Tax=Actinophytocola sp. TaxID=1872138 RepID=UPI002DDD295B|nr:hypothetical protein [Actinophytocola sp.]HEV2778824.1 hypothetical protein [Actinophytocola sp.]